ncbi:hypothetical protein, partial [Salmonella enterica]|uniref:hypothetical protein n=1 Tax=Salmonella enterica TaxID=28901 RepID=UPI003D27F96F
MVAKRSIGIVSLIAIQSIVAIASVASADETKVYNATVCDLLMYRHAFDQKTVRVHAIFVGGLLEHTAILDATCKALGGISVVNDTG